MAKIIDQIVLEIFDGKWGSGDDRKKKLEAAGYNYDAIQKRVTEVAAHMKTRKAAMKPWFDACKAQWEWSYNAKYNWGKWDKTIAGSKNYGTCITYPNTVAMRCGLIKEKGKIITSTGSNNDSKATQESFYENSEKAMSSINRKYGSAIKFPNKTVAQLIKEGKLKEGDIIGFMGHTTSYAGKNSQGKLTYNNAGHAAGIYDNSKAGSNRAMLNQVVAGYTNRKVYGVFSVNTFIVLTSCSNGTISYSDRYMAGQNATITIKPNIGYAVKSLKIDGKDVGAVTSYTIKKIDSHHIVEAVCALNAPVKKSVDELAQEVLAGKWGGGVERKSRLTAAGYDYNAVQAKVNELLVPKKKTVAEIAQEVLDGKWGSGDTRKSRLKKAGYNYDAVQNEVNKILAAREAAKKAALVDKIAKEVIAGKWGSGDERKKKLVKAGYDYNAIQKRVNELVVPVKKAYAGLLPTTTLRKSNAQVIEDTVKWALWIAGDNRFHYGYTNKAKDANAHHNGCYFCGTNKNQKRNMLDPKFTYCCNPFIGAAWAHGGGVPKALSLCQSTSSWNFAKGSGYDKSSLFDNLGHPAKSKLKPGDVLCRDTHVAMVASVNGSTVKIVEAGAGDDNVRNSSKWNNSIRVKTLTDANYKNFPRVHRFNGSVNTIIAIKYGEVSTRVVQWQSFLDWYFDGKVGKADGYFGDNTLTWTKEFQEKVIGKGQGDGIVGPKTLAAAASVKK